MKIERSDSKIEDRYGRIPFAPQYGRRYLLSLRFKIRPIPANPHGKVRKEFFSLFAKRKDIYTFFNMEILLRLCRFKVANFIQLRL